MKAPYWTAHFRLPEHERLPVFVEVFPREGFWSWWRRLVRANALSHHETIFWLASLTTCYLHNDPLWSTRFPQEIDVEHLDAISRMSGVSVPILKQSLEGESWRIHQFRLGHDFSGIESRIPQHYCPFCVEDDAVPYLRATWSSPFSLVCLIHRVLHREVCQRCGAPFNETKPQVNDNENLCDCKELAFSTLPAVRVRINDLSMLEEFLQGRGREIPRCLPFRKRPWFHSVSKTQWDGFFRWLLRLALKYWLDFRPQEREKFWGLNQRPQIEVANVELRCEWMRKLIVVLEMIEYDFETLAHVLRNEVYLPLALFRSIKRNRLAVAFGYALDDAQTNDCPPDWDLCWYRAGWIPDWQL